VKLTLRDITFEVVYQELMSEFDVIFQKESERSNVTNVDDIQGPSADGAAAHELTDDFVSDDYLLSKMERDKALDDLREKLNENLIGPYSEERHKIVDRFIKDHCKLRSIKKVDYNFFLAFFDCLLDKSFTSLNLTSRGYHLCPLDSSELLSILIRRSPHIQSLGLYFESSEFAKTLLPTLGPIFKSFKHLTSLDFSSFSLRSNKIDLLPFFTSLGDSCPKLMRLCFDKWFTFESDYALALVLGKKHELTHQLNQSILSSEMATLVFTSHCITPICSNLQELSAKTAKHQYVVAFILRHFPNLKKCLPHGSGNGEALIYLHQQQQQKNVTPPSTFGIFSEQLGLIEWTANTPFRGTFLNHFM